MTDDEAPPSLLVLVVEDEPPMRRFLRASLVSAGYRVVEAASQPEAMQLASSHNPDLVILDLGLPGGDGLDVTRRLREWSAVPIIVVSARLRDDDKVSALDAGADDYLTKPFSVVELLARLRVARRHALARAAGQSDPEIRVGGLLVDRARHRVTLDGRELKLTPIEFKLLTVLATNAGRVLTHQQILAAVWGQTHEGQTHTLRVHMADLRRKLEPEPARPRLLLTEPGVGYRMADRTP
jgi:two-component system, OmpR family, KDP operon response regulator KdpE